MEWLKRFKIKRLHNQLKLLSVGRLNNTSSPAALKKEISLYYTLAKIYESMINKKKHPFAREQLMACYRALASLDDAQAQFIMGEKTLAEAKVRQELQDSGILASEANAAYVNKLFEDVHGFFLAAEKNKHVKAKRLRGLCYINGWGVPINKDLGFDLLVASIEEENAWNKVQKIFKELGINQASFFSELFQHRKK